MDVGLYTLYNLWLHYPGAVYRFSHHSIGGYVCQDSNAGWVPIEDEHGVMGNTDLNIREYATYDEFARGWDGSDTDTRMLWQLLGQLDEEELLIVIPEWLAEEKVGFVDGAIPTVFVGRVGEETEKAIRLTETAAARSVMKLAHRIHQLEQNEDDPERNEWLDHQLRERRREFEQRADAVSLKDEWLPKSQLRQVVRRP